MQHGLCRRNGLARCCKIDARLYLPLSTARCPSMSATCSAHPSSIAAGQLQYRLYDHGRCLRAYASPGDNSLCKLELIAGNVIAFTQRMAESLWTSSRTYWILAALTGFILLSLHLPSLRAYYAHEQHNVGSQHADTVLYRLCPWTWHHGAIAQKSRRSR